MLAVGSHGLLHIKIFTRLSHKLQPEDCGWRPNCTPVKSYAGEGDRELMATASTPVHWLDGIRKSIADPSAYPGTQRHYLELAYCAILKIATDSGFAVGQIAMMAYQGWHR